MNFPEYFLFTHICAHILWRFNDHPNYYDVTKVAMHMADKTLHKFPTMHGSPQPTLELSLQISAS